MRHEMGVALASHPIRDHIPAESWMSSHQVDDVAAHLSEDAMADYDIIEGDYQWPIGWSRLRRALMAYACQSEFQLLVYLQGLRDAASSGHFSIEPGFRDKKVDWVAGIRRGEQDAISRT